MDGTGGTPSAALAEDPPEEAVGPLIRGLAVIRHLTLTGGRRVVSELVRETGLARSTVDRILGTLARLGYARLGEREVALAPPLMELGNAYLAASRIPALLGPIADRLAEELDESVSIAVPDRDGVRFVHQMPRRRTMSVTFHVGDLLPAESAAPGALFAAHWSPADWERWRARVAEDPGYASFPVLPDGTARGAGTFAARAERARADGWSVDDQQIEPGLIAVAVPVRDPDGRPLCALSVVSHTSRHTAGSLRDAVLGRMRETAAAMERALASPSGAPGGATAAGVDEAGGPAAGAPSATPSGASAETPADAPADPATGASAETAAGAARQREPGAEDRATGPEYIESFARGLRVLTAFGARTEAVSLTELAELTGLPRATVRRALITLTHLGYVAAEGRLFRLTPRVLDLGFPCLARLTLSRIALPHLAWLSAQVNDSASMAVLAGDEIQYVARVPTVRIMSVDITVGTRFPAYATSMGRVLLAGLPREERDAILARTDLRPFTRRTITGRARLAAVLDRTARDGYALVDQELEDGLRSIAVPVRDRAGRVVAAVNVSSHAARRTAEQAREAVLPLLRRAAARIEHDYHIATRFARIPVA